MFPDGNIEQYAANFVAESICMDCYDEGRRSQIMDGILEFHWSGDSLTNDESMIVEANGQKKQVKNTKGWKFSLIKWKDSKRSWVSFKDIKDLYLLDVAEFATEMGIQDEQVFKW